MSRNVVRPVILAYVAVLLAALAGAQEKAVPRPKAVVDEPLTILQPIPKGDKVTHDFFIRNEGDAALELAEVISSCGCTVASFDKTIAPGETGKVHAELDTQAFLGPISKSITVLTNDAANPRLVLTMQTEVVPVVYAKPGYVRFLFVQGMSGGSVTQTVFASKVEDFQVTGVTSPYPFIKTSFREAKPEERLAEASGRQWRVEATIESSAEVGPLREPIRVQTNHPRQSELEIPLSGFVRPLFAATPAMLDFGAIEVSEKKNYGFAFINFGADPVEIKKVEVTLPGITAQPKALRPGHRFQIELTFTPEMAKGVQTGAVRIFTTSAKVPIFEVPLRGTVR